MKKIISLVLILALSLPICACGGQSKEESLPGEYASVLWFLDGKALILNDNETFKWVLGEEKIDGDKGTFTMNGSKLTLFDAKNKNNKVAYELKGNTLRLVSNNGVQDTSWRFEKDEEYGLEFSPNDKGLTDQTFTACVLNTNIPGCSYNYIMLDLDDDGSFILKLGKRGYSSLDYKETYEGTYTYEKSTLTLNYQENSYPLYVDDNNIIYFVLYQKV